LTEAGLGEKRDGNGKGGSRGWSTFGEEKDDFILYHKKKEKNTRDRGVRLKRRTKVGFQIQVRGWGGGVLILRFLGEQEGGPE